eukprot:CAMPEP_0201098778 /NCGR_PEP_ID=MMETSP0812-20130820/7808_1 /ASSEMBLY_ACC=CAM_ASM_000668 /TAXON_ID=98059 /ORGANISM="Dinobryon sp., Strain UTEXLB2267" /LENGTH=554 /DNA_ID=CAMNT_0047354381 /DNA_START=334 /DNA_END=1998 /DNA_ORIENTATION=+
MHDGRNIVKKNLILVDNPSKRTSVVFSFAVNNEDIRKFCRPIGHVGLYRNLRQFHDVWYHARQLEARLLGDCSHSEAWEEVLTPIIRDFLRRLIYESSFSFADKVNMLACEIVSSVFLDMKGLSVSLQQAMDRHLSAAFSGPRTLYLSPGPEEVLQGFISRALTEEDRKFSVRGLCASEQRESMLAALSRLARQGGHDCRQSGDSGASSIALERLYPDRDRTPLGPQAFPGQLLQVFLVELVYLQLTRLLRRLLQLVLEQQQGLALAASQRYRLCLERRGPRAAPPLPWAPDRARSLSGAGYASVTPVRAHVCASTGPWLTPFAGPATPLAPPPSLRPPSDHSYVQAIQTLVDLASDCPGPAPPLQYEVLECVQATRMEGCGPGGVKESLAVEAGHLVVLVDTPSFSGPLHPPALETPQHSHYQALPGHFHEEAVPAIAFYDLVLRVFCHELLTGYEWDRQPDNHQDLHNPHPQHTHGFCSVRDGSLHIKSFRPSNGLSFYVPFLRTISKPRQKRHSSRQTPAVESRCKEEDREVLEGEGEDSDVDEGYMSDGF